MLNNCKNCGGELYRTKSDHIIHNDIETACFSPEPEEVIYSDEEWRSWGFDVI